jgi:hypothetical protein
LFEEKLIDAIALKFLSSTAIAADMLGRLSPLANSKTRTVVINPGVDTVL